MGKSAKVARLCGNFSTHKKNVKQRVLIEKKSKSKKSNEIKKERVEKKKMNPK